MKIDQLGYLVVQTTDLGKWRHFATQVVGMAAADGPDGSLYLKIDGREHRVLVVEGDRDGLVASGWEMRSEADFVALRSKLVNANVEVSAGNPSQCALRKVTDMFTCTDPSGNRIEVYWGPISDFTRFVSPIGVSAFVTGSMGMGHVVLPSLNFDATKEFWTQTMGFGMSDILHVPFGPDKVGRIHFLHCNPRQHSLALAEMPSPANCIHMMLEVPDMDEVGRALDRVAAHQVPLAASLGRHVNDDMTSFYVWTPGGFALEFGCGGLVKDWEKEHTVFETTRGSHWGHHWQAPPSA
ncbi:VOC family protein [Paraburkholderia sp. HP33-1]|uniref:VOC family protein n=1 Tax=Paraburkholderia sp. HP33-1 TaxID=2883243 RepID=UPI001F3C6D51|nr:VOC family protein [Paraburkholderia sp. HP33-1]